MNSYWRTVRVDGIGGSRRRGDLGLSRRELFYVYDDISRNMQESEWFL